MQTADRKIQWEKIGMTDRWPGLQTRPCPLSKKFARVTQNKNCGRGGVWTQQSTGADIFVLFPKIPTDMICECRHCSQ